MTAVLVLSGCGVAATPVGDPTPVRETWRLRHDVRASAGVSITGHTVTADSESTGLRIGSDECFVSVSAPGTGGPENRVGKQVKTTFGGRPAIRNGAGAEGSYLMWRLDDASWVEATCSDPEDAAGVDRAAAAFRLRAGSVGLPFSVSGLPDGLAVSMISQELTSGSADVYLGRTGSSDFRISLLPKDWAPAPTGRSLSINGHPAVEVTTGSDISYFLSVQNRLLLVGTFAGDTGPYPDRSGDRPLILELAQRVVPAADLADPSTWQPAENSFG